MDHTSKRALKDVQFMTWSGSDYHDSWVNYGLRIGKVDIELDDKDAEKIMLAAGIGDIVWTIDWGKIGKPYDHRNAIVPRIRGMVKGETVYKSKEQAQEKVDQELQNRIDALTKLRYS